jgi:predicted transcriptional regulator
MSLRHCIWLGAMSVVWAVAPLRAGEVDKYLPDDTEMLIAVNVKQIVKSELFKKNVEAKAREALKNQDELQDALKDLGFDPFTDIERVVVARAASADLDRGLIIVHGKFDLDKFQAKAEKIAKDQPDLLKVHKVANGAGGKFLVYEVMPSENAPSIFVALPNKSTLLASPGKDYVVDALKKDKPSLKNKDIAALLERMNDKQGVSAAVTGKALVESASPEVKDLFSKVDAVGGGVTIGDEIKLEIAVSTKNADDAKTIKDELDGGLKQARLTLAALAFADSNQIDALLDVVNSIKASVKDKTVLIKAAVSPEAIENALKKN